MRRSEWPLKFDAITSDRGSSFPAAHFTPEGLCMQTNLLHYADQRSIKTVTLPLTGVERDVSRSISKIAVKKLLSNNAGVLKIGFRLRHHMSMHLTGELDIQLWCLS